MNTPTPETRDSEEYAGSVMESLCPAHQDRALVLRQLLDSIGVAASISDDIWAVTLFENGFRLNVGTVEVMTFKTVPQSWPFPGSVREPDLFEIRLLLHGDIAADLQKLINGDENTHGIFPSNYKSVPQPQSCYVGRGELVDGALSNDSYQKIEKGLRLFAPHHAEFIRHAAHTPTGKVRTKSNFSRTHSPGLYRYAQSFILDGREATSTQYDMEHFIAYHSAQKMGYEFESSGELRFLSRKFGVLKRAVGNTVWVVQGLPDGKKTAYSLCGAYVADRIDVEDPDSNLYVISGHRVKEFAPPVPLNNLDWFPSLLKSQSNFSLGFNRLSDEAIVQALATLQAKGNQSPSTSTLPDIDLPATGTEGAARLVSHLRRERNHTLVEAKKAATLSAKGWLRCEACGFDFSVTYGALGEGFCEVHHLVPLSAASESVTTTLNDLAVLCSNCHRVIHRSTPMLSVAELSKVVTLGRP